MFNILKIEFLQNILGHPEIVLHARTIEGRGLAKKPKMLNWVFFFD